MRNKSDLLVWLICAAVGWFVYWITDTSFAVRVTLGFVVFVSLYSGFRNGVWREDAEHHRDQEADSTSEIEEVVRGLRDQLSDLSEEVEKNDGALAQLNELRREFHVVTSELETELRQVQYEKSQSDERVSRLERALRNATAAQ